MREIKKISIKIETGAVKEFIIKELTLNHLLELSQTNSLLGGSSSQDNPGENIPGLFIINRLLSFRPDVERIMKLSCDFTFDDLLTLPPSDIKILFEGFQEVNQTFLDVSEKLGILEIPKMLLKDFTKVFLK